jgi:hypothetical protein
MATRLASSRVSNPAAVRWSSNLQIETALAGLASKLIVAAIVAVSEPQIGNHFIVYPATGALEITSPYRHEGTKALESVIRNMKPSFYSTFAVSIAESFR